MKRRIEILVAIAVAVFALHAGISIWQSERIASQWVAIEGPSALVQYFVQQDYLLGLAYAVVAAFTMDSWLRARANAKSGAASLAGGFTLAALFSWAGCWLLGCCGSPLLPVYLSLLGSSFAGVTKPLALTLTLLTVGASLWWRRRKQRNAACDCAAPCLKTESNDGGTLSEIRAELAEGMNLPKCQQCGCMKETLEQMSAALTSLGSPNVTLAAEIRAWQPQMKAIKYACLGCAHCYPAVAMNVLHKGFPETEKLASLACDFEVRPEIWPPVPGEYFEFCDGETCPVAVSTLASTELTDTLARRRPRELCIVGKTETENIGVDKVIKNTISNRTIRYLLLTGREPQGHQTGKTLLALATNGVDASMRVIGSPGRRPILRNVTRDDVQAFRKQVEVVDMIGCDDADQIIGRVKELAAKQPETCDCSNPVDPLPDTATSSTAPIVPAQPPAHIELDKSGYFVILPRPDRGDLVVEHYSYDNTLLRTIVGGDARSIYWTIVQNGWVSQLSHAAYLGKELSRAEHSLKHSFKFVQDGAY